MPFQRLYTSRFERLVANTELADPENPLSCWVWVGQCQHNGYPRFTERVHGIKHPVKRQAHRAILEEVHDVEFPFDEAGHSCYNPSCVSPFHLEIQTPVFNQSQRRDRLRSAIPEGRLIPVLFPRPDPLQEAANEAWEGGSPGEVAPPF